MDEMKKFGKYTAMMLALLLFAAQPSSVSATLTQAEQEESLRRRESEKLAQAETETETETAAEAEDATEDKVLLVAIDPCHQAPGADITSEELIGPGAEETCPRASEGGSGCVSGQEEYDLNLQVALLLEEELEERGYEVVLTRDSNEVDMSNHDRCAIANEAGADIMVRLYASSEEDESIYGARAYCPTSESPYLQELYHSCLNLADCVLDAYCEATGISNHRLWMTDRVAGINWCEMPVMQLEMGNLQNSYNDAYMAEEENRVTMAEGIADGIDVYFGR